MQFAGGEVRSPDLSTLVLSDGGSTTAIALPGSRHWSGTDPVICGSTVRHAHRGVTQVTLQFAITGWLQGFGNAAGEPPRRSARAPGRQVKEDPTRLKSGETNPTRVNSQKKQGRKCSANTSHMPVTISTVPPPPTAIPTYA